MGQANLETCLSDPRNWEKIEGIEIVLLKEADEELIWWNEEFLKVSQQADVVDQNEKDL